jgi:hypothetical protein
MRRRTISFKQACNRYVHRFTMNHMPSWARSRPIDHGGTETRYYAPHYRDDDEWYENTIFPGEVGWLGIGTDCYSTNQTFPIGNWLDTPYTPVRVNR